MRDEGEMMGRRTGGRFWSLRLFLRRYLRDESAPSAFVDAEFRPDRQMVRDLRGALDRQIELAHQVEDFRLSGELARGAAIKNDIIQQVRALGGGRHIRNGNRRA